MEINYGSKEIEISMDDGTTLLVTQGFFNGQPSSVKQKKREDIEVDRNNLYKEWVSVLDLLKTDSQEIVAVIKRDKLMNPYILQRIHTIKSERTGKNKQ